MNPILTEAFQINLAYIEFNFNLKKIYIWRKNPAEGIRISCIKRIMVEKDKEENDTDCKNIKKRR